MYSNTYVAAGIGAVGTITSISGWTVAGWLILGAAVCSAFGLAAGKLRRGRT